MGPMRRTKPKASTYHGAPQHTPRAVKISSDPRSQYKNYHVSVMKTLILQELKDSLWHDVDVMQLIGLLLPQPDPPLDIDDLLKSNKMLSQSLEWHTSLSMPNTVTGQSAKGSTVTGQSAEFRVATWLNKISNIYGKLGKPDSQLINPPRLWNSDACQRPLPGKTKRKPDIILTDNYTRRGQKVWGWEDVHVFIEVTSKQPPKNILCAQMRATLYSKAFMVFQAQPNRRFVLALTICRSQMYINLLDRAGAVHSSPINMVEQPAVVLRVLMGIVFATASTIGYDPSITDVDGAKVACCKNQKYAIDSILFAHHMIRGRATICWRARKDKEDYVIKDSWPNVKRTQSESQFLRKAAEKNITGVPVLVDDEDLKVDGTTDNTDNRRVLSGGGRKIKESIKKREEEVDSRVHRRLVLQPAAIPLPYFSSKRELVSVLIDIIKVHKRLVGEAKILHRDISINNIMMYKPKDESHAPPFDSQGPQIAHAPLKRGLLIDFDYAAYLDAINQITSPGHRTGTLPFMAIEILLGGETVHHRVTHDLESLFYVLIWICMMYEGPGNQERTWTLKEEHPLSDWHDSSAPLTRAGNVKAGQCSSLGAFNSRILQYFSPYFNDLKECCRELRHLIFHLSEQGTMIDVTHDKMAQVLQRTLDTLQPEPSVPNPDDPSTKLARIVVEGGNAGSRGNERRATFHGETKDETTGDKDMAIVREDEVMSDEDMETVQEDEEGEAEESAVSDDDMKAEAEDDSNSYANDGGGERSRFRSYIAQHYSQDYAHRSSSRARSSSPCLSAAQRRVQK